MLIDFTVQNFKSIHSPVTLSAETGERLRKLQASNTMMVGKLRLLKNLVIVGANGSGKTNLIEAIATMRDIVLQERPRITDPMRYLPFQLASDAVAAPTQMSINFITAGRQFRYTLHYRQTAVVEESLAIVKNGRLKPYFQRVGQTYPCVPQGLEKLSRMTKPNSLFLFNAQAANDAVAIKVFRWFQADLVLVHDDRPLDAELIDLIQTPKIKAQFLRFLRFADFNIVDLLVRQVPLRIPQTLMRELQTYREAQGKDFALTQPELYTVHKVYNAAGDVVGQSELPLSSESQGTQKIFAIGLSMIQAQHSGSGRTLLFDEFGDALHLELASALVEIFNSEQNHNQFILTTHELQLLDEKLRIDQIYLMEKDFKGQSDLKSIFDFQDARELGRGDTSFMKRYIQGRFGALPQISVAAMREALTAVDTMSEASKE